jgi:hypothetical protein
MNHTLKRAARILASALAWALASIAILASAQVLPDKPLKASDFVGRWEEAGEPEDTSWIEFYADGTVVMSTKGETLGSTQPGEAKLRYRIDTSHHPAWFDLVLVAPNGLEISVFKMIIDVVEVDTIRMASSTDPDERPPAFVGTDILPSGKLRKVK